MTGVAATTGLTAEQVERFHAEGYLVVEGVLDAERDIAPVMREYAAVLDGIARELHAAGEIGSAYADLDFDARLIRVCEESGRNFPQHFDFSLPQTGVKHDTPIHVGPGVFGLLTNPRLLDVAESLLGLEIYSNPVQHIRMKLPHRAVASRGDYNGLITKVPWHQDNGVILPEADAATILTVWMPITPATQANGCLQVIPRSHREGLIPHCPGAQGTAIPDTLMADREARPQPLRPGDLLLMTQRTIHSSLDNVTEDQVRISFDLRYQPIGQPTGRPMFPGFVARSARHPEAELHDPREWARLWYETRAKLAEMENPSFNRWTKDAAVCA